MKPLLFALPGNEELTSRLSAHLAAERGDLESRRFPDGETYVRLLAEVQGRSVVFI